MPSGKRARQQRQAATAGGAPPPVRSKGAPRGKRQASPRALAIGGGIVAIVAIAIVLAVVLGRSSGGNNNSTGTTPTIGKCDWTGGLQGACDANNLFKGIPQSGLTLGKATAPVQMTIFIDPQCPVCRDYETNYLPDVVQKYVRPGKVQLILKPWAFIGPQSFTGRLAIIAASFQNKAYDYAKVLYDNQGEERTGWLTTHAMENIGASVNGLNVPQMMRDRNSARAKRIAQEVSSLATAWKVEGTPTIYVNKVGQQPTAVMPPGQYIPANVEPALNAALGQ